MTTTSNASIPPEAILQRLKDVLEDFIEDWDIELEEEIGRDTLLLADLEFESIDIIQLVVAIEETFGKRKLPFEQVLMKDGRYVDDLSVGAIADFLHGQFS
ncbi:MAG: acyl carrier protein [Algiphilus sp.]|uniref:acyl carrier protein n=1 Tax=Algiphilus sp. TaxID=1872431 RepID=UPI001CA67C72|nr:acyl carrier protein [Algiphilus sp.]MBY8966094.1 acyl carrier protein [Algiphilus acroporae]MCI5062821.1 acyl carrier protein [Algiphilus sp.]MCI5104891.1 acyl carrier protein [Algiphilus sp.]